jgi:hypothetical protein
MKFVLALSLLAAAAAEQQDVEVSICKLTHVVQPHPHLVYRPQDVHIIVS